MKAKRPSDIAASGPIVSKPERGKRPASKRPEPLEPVESGPAAQANGLASTSELPDFAAADATAQQAPRPEVQGDEQERVVWHQRLRELEDEVASLRQELERQRQVRRGARQLSTFVTAQVLLGPGLNKALRDWFEVTLNQHRLPVEETAHVVAAVIRRVFRVALAGLMVTLLPTSILIWQNFIMTEQNLFMRAQNSSLREQIELDRSESQSNRRAELFRTIYSVTDCRQGLVDPDCPPLFPERVRVEALEAVAQIAHGRAESLDLRGLRLARASLDGLDLSGFLLSNAKLDDSSLIGARLNDAVLDGSTLDRSVLVDAELDASSFFDVSAQETVFTGSSLQDAVFTDARLANATLERSSLENSRFIRTGLSGVDFGEASLQGASFDGCDLSRAVFRNARLRDTRFQDNDLSNADFEGAFVASAEWLEAMRSGGNRGFDPQRWSVEPLGPYLRVSLRSRAAPPQTQP